MSKSCKSYNRNVFALRLTHIGTFVTCKVTRIWGFHSSPTTSKHWESFDSKLADVGNPPVRQLGRHLCRPRADWSPPGNRGKLTCSRPAEAVPKKTTKSAQRVVLWLLGYRDWGFPCFSSVVRQMPGYNSKRARPASPITEALNQSDPPPTQIAEAFSQSDPNISGFNSQKSHPTKIPLIKDKFPGGVIPH
jgi:hypothetical protein